MSTNCYHYKETWTFDSKNPSEFFGWGIMTSGGQFQIATFRAPGMRDEMAKEVHEVLAKAFEPAHLADIDDELVAACFLIMAGGNEEDQSSAQYIAEEELEAMPAEGNDFWEQLTEIGSKYAMM
jgi:hypothetical protein